MAFSTTFLITLFLVILIPNVATITFNYTHIGPQYENVEIVTEGDTPFISNAGIELNPDDNGLGRRGLAGRAIYIKPLHLWDKQTGELASFYTNFTFVIDSDQEMVYGGGLTFFLAQNNSVITGGHALGLPIDNTSMKPLSPFVAVEFDTYWNSGWDPSISNSSIGDHVGISINSLVSVRYKKWFSNVAGGGVCQAWIAYDSLSKNLSVSFSAFVNNTKVRQDGLFYTVDLRKELPERVIFGFSGGTVFELYESQIVISWSFNSTDLHVKDNALGLIVGMSVVIIFLTLLVFVLRMFKKKKIRKNEEGEGFDVEMNNDFEKGTGPKRFSYYNLARSTCNFAENQKLGEGGFGGVYKGFFKDSNTSIAVKRVSRSSKQGIKEYTSEVMIISRLRHKNLVQLIGWCHENKELMLVYEFMENGSLDSHLFKEKSLLTWNTRYKIAHGLGCALLYLHDECDQCVLHGDIKSSNVMLDSNFNPKLGDFGLAKLVEHEKGSKITMSAGTMGYMAPECVVSGKVSKESDVYSFGIVALEIASGRRTIVNSVKETQIRLVEWVWGLYGADTLLEAADPRLCSDFDENEMKQLMIVGLWCAHPDLNQRPSMRQVMQVLSFEASLPNLPPVMPMATYIVPSTSFFYGVTSIIHEQLLKLYKFILILDT